MNYAYLLHSKVMDKVNTKHRLFLILKLILAAKCADSQKGQPET